MEQTESTMSIFFFSFTMMNSSGISASLLSLGAVDFGKVIIFHFSFQRTKEGLSDCVVPTISLSTITPSEFII
ncbi:hypothetical protein [Leptospira sp. Pond_2020]|uniref:hypothetical protein n=1 Tax=Leptospira sp. Pond_2020 TaxID=2846916 RepID=UPI001E4104EF|nr:hypothetical protein [Leptospira sp. Pond_2020]MCD1183209.1 hypothetical protein [Leptospira sp. Pond_2020]